MKFYPKTLMAVMITAFGSASAWADEQAETMVQEALPVMYHTCASVIEEADGEDLYVLDVIEKMTALSLYNRAIDIEDLSLSEEQKTKLRDEFLGALQAGCADDTNALLAGVVDAAVKSSTGQ